MTKPRELSLLIAAVMLPMLAGCARQDFEILPLARSQELLALNRHVLEVTTQEVGEEEHVDIVLGTMRRNWITMRVEGVLKGAEKERTLRLSKYRPLTVEEAAMFPGGVGIVSGMRLRLGYDVRAESRFTNLRIVPLVQYGTAFSDDVAASIDPPARARIQSATQPARFELTAKRFSDDQIDLSWTAWKGAATYRVEISEDGVEFHELIEVDATDTKASLVGFDEAIEGESYHIRIAAMDESEGVLARSNVRIIKR